jgi:hypothetical protein
MSYAIVRVQKFKATAVKAIQFHNLREKDSRTNPDIDKSRTKENYVLVECPDFRKAIAERLETLQTSRAVRKDAVVMAQVLVTSGPEFFQDMPRDKQQKFFQNSLDFLADRYGKENILSAVVHMDERTPHMHVDLTPIRDGRLTAKTIFTRGELGQLQTDFAREVGQAWGLQRGESREEKRRHLSTEEYKIHARREELERQARELNPEVPEIRPDEVTPQKLGLFQKERPLQVAERLNQKFQPLKDTVAQLRTLQGKVRTLEKEVEAARPELERLKRYQNAYALGLSIPQQKALVAHADQFRSQNKAEAEKARQEAEEREKQAKERQRVKQQFERALRNTPGTVGQHMERCKELMALWDSSGEKAEFEKSVMERFEQSRPKARGMRMR